MSRWQLLVTFEGHRRKDTPGNTSWLQATGSIGLVARQEDLPEQLTNLSGGYFSLGFNAYK